MISLREGGVLREGDFNFFSSVSLPVSNKHEANLLGNSFMETVHHSAGGSESLYPMSPWDHADTVAFPSLLSTQKSHLMTN